MRVPSGESAVGFTSSPSPKESDRFGFEVRRYSIGSADARHLIEAIRAEAPSLAIVRLPATRPDLLRRFREICADVILGDCLVVYRRDNAREGRPSGPSNETFTVRRATPDDFDLLNGLTDGIFADYRNHYASNPRLADFDLSEGYREWTRGHVDAPGLRCLIGAVEGVECCYGTVALDADECEIVLNGVLPAYRSRGVYRDLLKAMVTLFMDEGAARSMISTQVDNSAVQRVWVREGFLPAEAYLTVHLNL